MPKYTVAIHGQPVEYEHIEADTEEEAELKAVHAYNGGRYEDVYKTEMTLEEDEEDEDEDDEEACPSCGKTPDNLSRCDCCNKDSI